MSNVFFMLTIFSATFLAWNLVPSGLGKLKNLDANLPTFTSLFGRFGMPTLVGVGAIEALVPVLLIISVLINSAFTDVFVGLIALVMFGATTVHVVVWKNSPKQPLILFIATLLVLVFSKLTV